MANKALLLDRDGVINVNHGYVYQINDFDFIEGITDLCKAAIAKQYQIVIVTNQSGIAREYYSRGDFYRLTAWLEHEFWRNGVRISHTYHCPHHPKQEGPFGFPCCCRKPKPGMLFKAQRQFKIDLAESVMVGDSLSDMICAQLAGVKKRVLFKPNSIQYAPQLLAPGRKPYYRAKTLRAIQSLL